MNGLCQCQKITHVRVMAMPENNPCLTTTIINIGGYGTFVARPVP